VEVGLSLCARRLVVLRASAWLFRHTHQRHAVAAPPSRNSSRHASSRSHHVTQHGACCPLAAPPYRPPQHLTDTAEECPGSTSERGLLNSMFEKPRSAPLPVTRLFPGGSIRPAQGRSPRATAPARPEFRAVHMRARAASSLPRSKPVILNRALRERILQRFHAGFASVCTVASAARPPLHHKVRLGFEVHEARIG